MPTTPQPRPTILSIEPYVGGESKLPGVNRIVKLSSNESPYGPLPSVLDAVAAATTRINRYPDTGAAELTAALADRFSVPEAHLALGAGSVGVLQQLGVVVLLDRVVLEERLEG